MVARRRWVAAGRGLGLLGGAFVAEGLARIGINHDRAAGLAMVLAGVVIPLALGRSGRERTRSLLAIVPVVAVTAVAYKIINWLFLHG